MKKTTYFVMVFLLFLFSCTKKGDVDNTNGILTKEVLPKEVLPIEEQAFVVEEIQEIDKPKPPETIKKMFVNSPEGLRIRNSPGIEGERIGLLENISEVVVMREDDNYITIDGITGKWVLIESGNIQGWVFDGYLTDSPMNVQKQVFSSMYDLANFIFFENLKIVYGLWFPTLNDALNANNHKIIRERNYLDTRGISPADRASTPPNAKEYLVEYDQYILANINMSIARPERGYYLSALEVKLDETNFLNIFPYRTINEYVNADNFAESSRRGVYREPGDIWYGGYADYGDEYIIYFLGSGTCSLNFRNGLLISIGFQSIDS